MKISKRISIQDGVKWNLLIKRTLCKKNCYKNHAYFVCSSPQEKLLFEIVESRWISSWYEAQTVFAICKTKKQAIEEVRQLVDALYNTKKLSYADLLE